ncbi:MAG: hypothetical protein AAF662_10070 [Pseudomonadota bacterium]
MTKPTDFGVFINELDAGVFSDKLAHELSTAALAVVQHDRVGQLQITLDIKKIGTSQVTVSHKMRSTRPTMRGKQTEEDTTETAMHVGKGGRMTFFPESQVDMFTGEVKDKETQS